MLLYLQIKPERVHERWRKTWLTNNSPGWRWNILDQFMSTGSLSCSRMMCVPLFPGILLAGAMTHRGTELDHSSGNPARDCRCQEVSCTITQEVTSVPMSRFSSLRMTFIILIRFCGSNSFGVFSSLCFWVKEIKTLCVLSVNKSGWFFLLFYILLRKTDFWVQRLFSTHRPWVAGSIHICTRLEAELLS